MRQFERFVRNAHPGVLIVLLVSGLFLAFPLITAVTDLVATAFQLAGGLVEMSGVEESIPVFMDALDVEIEG